MDNAQEVTNGGAPNAEQRQWAMFAHFSAIVTGIFGLGFLGPLVIWLMKKESMPFVNDQGKEALNFQITVLIAFIICIILSFVVIGLFLMVVVGIAALVFEIIAGIKANNGVTYRYPVTLRLVK